MVYINVNIYKNNIFYAIKHIKVDKWNGKNPSFLKKWIIYRWQILI